MEYSCLFSADPELNFGRVGLLGEDCIFSGEHVLTLSVRYPFKELFLPVLAINCFIANILFLILVSNRGSLINLLSLKIFSLYLFYFYGDKSICSVD
jgi:hypothetical protein